MAWMKQFRPITVRAIGVAELAGAVGLVLPTLLGVAPVVTPLAAILLAILMAGAAATHVKLHEAPLAVPPIALGALAAVIAVRLY
jgi:hypothetical protein